MFPSYLFFICQIIFGWLLFSFFDPEKKFHFWERFMASIVVGYLLGSFSILLFTLVSKSLNQGIILFFLIFYLMLIFKIITFLLRLKNNFELGFFRAQLERIKAFGARLNSPLSPKTWFFLKKNGWLIILLGIVLIYSYFLTTVLFLGKDGNLQAVLIGWGDTALHLGLIERFATANPFKLEHPFFGGANLTYPFMIDFISGILRKFGADQIFAYRLPLMVFGVDGLLLMFAFSYRILKSKYFAILALILIIWGSGLGFSVLFKDLNSAYQEAKLTEFLKNPYHEYTHLDNRTGGKDSKKDTQDNIVWIVPAISFLSHQRTFTFGLAVFSVILLGICYYGRNKNFWRFGILAGLLPLVHGHSFLALFFLLGTLFWFFLSNWKGWLGFAFFTAVLALPQLVYYKSSAIFKQNLFKPWFGWMTCNHQKSFLFCSPQPGTDSSVLTFWSKNFGVIFWVWILTIFSLVLLKSYLRKNSKEEFHSSFIVASLVLFLLPNLFLFQPWEFDNNKIFFYWWILAILFCVIPFLKILWRSKVFGKLFVIGLVFLGTVAGVFDFTAKLFWTKKIGSFGYADWLKENIVMGQWIKDNLPANALFLTDQSVDPIPLFLAGRPVYLGFTGWLWTEGLDHSKNLRQAEEILQGDWQKACEEKIGYILLDDGLKKTFPRLNEQILRAKTKVIFTQVTIYGKKEILKVSCNNI